VYTVSLVVSELVQSAEPAEEGGSVNSFKSQNVIYGTAFLNTVLAAFKTIPAAALIATGKLRLSHDPAFNPVPGTALAALVAQEANFSGYPAGGAAVVLSAPVNLSPTAQGAVVSNLFLATTASPFVNDNCTGYWIDDGTNFIMGEAFGAGQAAAFSSPGDFLELIVELPMQAGQATV
jgi:hypothetical protein